jgi:Raf kinase inhibitor-like YbhB/YbcL family protein
MMRIALAAALAVAAASPAFALELTSPDVQDGQTWPTQFVCAKQGGQSIQPALAWSGAPDGTKSYAITMFDPDAGTKGFWHWALSDIPATETGLAQGADSGGTLPAGAKSLPNGTGKPGFIGPCPPVGPVHHYQITLYALPDANLAVTPDMKTPDIGALLDKTALASAKLTVPFQGK